MTINSDDIRDKFEEVFNALDEFRDHLLTAGDAAEASKKKTEKDRLEEKYKEQLKKNAAVFEQASNAVIGFTKQIGDGKGSQALEQAVMGLSGLLSKYGPLGMAIHGLVKLYAYASEEFDKLFGVFKEISESGVVTSVTDITNSMNKFGLGLDLTKQILIKNSVALSKFGGSALNGQKIFADYAEQVMDMREAFLNLGITAVDFNEYQANYMETLQIQGRLDQVTKEQFRSGLESYAIELDALSKLTGKNRKELAAEMKARQTDMQFRLLARGKGAEEETRLNATLSLIKAKMGDGMERAVKAGMLDKLTDPALQSYLIGIPNFLDITKRIEAGGDGAIEAINELARSSGAFSDTMPRELVANLKDGNKLLEVTTTGLIAGNNATIVSQSDLMKSIDKLKDDADTTTKNLADRENFNLKSQQQLQNTILGFSSLTTVMKLFAEAIEKATWFLNRITGGSNQQPAPSSPPPVTTPSTSRSSVSAAPTVATAAQSFASRSTSTQNQPHAATSGGDDKVILSTVTSKTGKSAQVAKQYAGAFQSLINDLDNRGYTINSLSGFVDRDVRGMPGVKSIHARGAAIDINPGANPMGPTLITDMPSDISQLAAAHGLGWGGNWRSKKDAMHFSAAKSEGGRLLEARNGIIADGPSTGYPVIHHGRELTSKINPNSILEHIATTPMQGSQSNTMMTDQISILNRKYDEMIKVLSDIRNIQRTLMRRAYA